MAHAPDGPEYHDTFITVAPDCPVAEAVVPERYRGRPTVATIQHELLADAAYELRQSDVLFLTHVRKRGVDLGTDPEDGASLRAALFATPQACLRASPLPKRYGWGLHFDADGRAALYGLGTPAYARFAAGEGVSTVVAAMRSARR